MFPLLLFLLFFFPQFYHNSSIRRSLYSRNKTEKVYPTIYLFAHTSILVCQPLMKQWKLYSLPKKIKERKTFPVSLTQWKIGGQSSKGKVFSFLFWSTEKNAVTAWCTIWVIEKPASQPIKHHFIQQWCCILDMDTRTQCQTGCLGVCGVCV